MAEYDVIVIGGGPGGYVAAIRAAQLGQKTAVVERDKAGGRCLNYACIPAKTVLHTAEIFQTVSEDGADLGIKASGTSIDWKALQERRTKVSKTLEDGVQFLWNKNKVEFLHGEASLAGAGKVKVGDDEHQAKAIVLATGSVALPIPGVDFSDRVIDTWGAYSLESMPKSLVVAGAGASGSEIASAYSRLGTDVTLIEMLDQILPLEDKDMARVVERQFKKDGMEVLTGTKVESVEEQKSGVKVKAGEKEIKADYLVIAGGRRPDTDPLNLDAAGVKTNDRGQIEVDDFQRTSADGVFAIGDLVRGPALAHKAEEEGVVAVETAAGAETEAVNIDLVPGATFTHPQVASVGMTEEQAKETGRQIKVGKFKLGGAGASVVYDDRAGLVKIVGDPEYGEILGAHIVGNIACDMISEICNVMALEGGYPELQRIIHPAPDDVGGGARRRPRRRRLGDPRVDEMKTNRLEAFQRRGLRGRDHPAGPRDQRPGRRAPVASAQGGVALLRLVLRQLLGDRDHLGQPPRRARSPQAHRPTVLYLNLLVLMTVVFIPFSTALMAEHLKSGADERVAAARVRAGFPRHGDRLRPALGYIVQHRQASSASSYPTRRSAACPSGFLIGNPFYAVAVVVAFISPAAVPDHRRRGRRLLHGRGMRSPDLWWSA